jgi:hypothetical protein
LSYWFFVEKLDDGRRQLTVYSFGPNRRRDSDEGSPGRMISPDDDDIAATGILPAPDEHASPESNLPAPPK